MTRAGARDDGSMALEFALVAPALLLLLAFLVACGRFTSAGATLDAGVRDAARAATTSRSAPEAQRRAATVVHAAVAPGACADSLVVDPLPEFVAGRPVTVTARCTVPVGDLGLPGMPGHLTVTSAFSSPLDPNRELS